MFKATQTSDRCLHVAKISKKSKLGPCKIWTVWLLVLLTPSLDNQSRVQNGTSNNKQYKDGCFPNVPTDIQG